MKEKRQVRPSPSIASLVFVITSVVCLVATNAIGQSAGPPASEIRQLAYEVVEKLVGAGVPIDRSSIPLFDSPFYRSNVYVRSQPTKSKHTIGGARLPKWSPNGERLAFLAPCGAVFCVEMADKDGSHRVSVTRNPTKVSGELMSAMNFAWSPSGQELAFVEEGRKAWTIISTVRSDGSSHKEFLRLNCLVADAELDWSPNGKSLAVTGCNGATGQVSLGQPTIAVIDLMTGENHVLAEGGGPKWSPDGTKLLFRGAGLTVTNADGTQKRKVVKGGLAGLGLGWFDNGQAILFGGAQDNDGPSEIFRINLDGSGLQKLASGAKHGLSFTNPILSPDEHSLIVSADTCFRCSVLDSAALSPALSMVRELSPDKSEPSILLIDLATGYEVSLANGSSPSVVWGYK